MNRAIGCRILLLLSALMFLSCAKQEVSAEDVVGNDPTLTGKLISVGIVPQDDSRTEVSVAGKVVWKLGDHIAVFVGGVAKDFSLISGAGSENAVFHCADVSPETPLDGVAVYPYRSGLTYEGGAVKVYVPREQSYDVSSAPMLASITSAGDRFFFYNLGGIFEFTYTHVPPEAKKLKFTAATPINGLFTLSSPTARLSTDTPCVPVASENIRETIVNLPVARPDGSVTVQLPVPAGDYAGFSLVLCLADGTEIRDETGMPDTYIQPKTGAKITAKVNKLSPIAPIQLPEGLKIEWMWDNDGTLRSFTGNVPAVDGNGNVYVQTGYDGKIFKLDRNGRKVWESTLTGVSGRCNTSPSLEEDGSVVYALGSWTSGQGKIFAFDASDGTRLWECTDYPSFLSSSIKIDKAMAAVGTGSNVYVPVSWSDGSTVLSIRKSDGHCLCYSSSNSDGSGANLRVSTGAIAISAAGLVCYQTNDGAAMMRQDKMDNPVTTNATWGKYVWYAYRDLWPASWGVFFNSTQGVICGRKGPTTGLNMVVSCAQEIIKNESDKETASRMDVYCSAADEIISQNLNGYRQQDVAYNSPDWHAFWRYQFGDHTTAGRPGNQDQGGIIMGHDDLEVLLPLKSNQASTGVDDHSRPVGPGGVVAIWVDRTPDKSSYRGATTSWRFNINTKSYANADTHSIESVAEVSGSPAVDNNGWVHVASRDRYHIFSAQSSGTYTISYLSRVNWLDLLNASGYFSKTVVTANAWTSVKLGDDGRIYLNLCLTFEGDATSRGVVLCLTYPGVISPDPTSSWPQKGADARNSCRQVSDASYWHIGSNPIPWK